MDTHREIEDRAAEWLARQDGVNWTTEDEANLQAWLEIETSHRVAYLRLKSTWDAAGRLRALRAGTGPERYTRSCVPPRHEWRGSPFFENKLRLDERRSLEPQDDSEDGSASISGQSALGNVTNKREASEQRLPLFHRGVIAAGILLVVIISGYTLSQWQAADERYSTPIGGFASVPMADGSKITLNTESEVRVAVTEKERRIDLEQGEAFFDVAKDETRPFVVKAGAKRVVAVGTKFSVRRSDNELLVLVTEGQVRVEEAGPLRMDPSTNTQLTTLLNAGDLARSDGVALVVERSQPPKVDALLSWREGYLRFHETSLADAVAEINRYNERKIVIIDPRVSNIKLSGTFRPNQYEAFVRVLEQGFAIRSHSEGTQILLSQ